MLSEDYAEGSNNVCICDAIVEKAETSVTAIRNIFSFEHETVIKFRKDQPLTPERIYAISPWTEGLHISRETICQPNLESLLRAITKLPNLQRITYLAIG